MPSWQVTGTRRNGECIRENFARAEEAQFRFTELEGELPELPSDATRAALNDLLLRIRLKSGLVRTPQPHLLHPAQQGCGVDSQ